MKKICIIYNPASGGGQSTKDDITQAFRDTDSELMFVEMRKNLLGAVRKCVQNGVSMLVAAGGDGTVSAVAGIAVKLQLPLGVLPVGTLNHFAKDIGLPMDLAEAAEVIVNGALAKVDYCTVNDRVFVNNSSVGLYPLTVIRREKMESVIGKWPAAIVAAIGSAIRLRTIRLAFVVDEQRHSFRTPLVFIGNNRYNFDEIGLSKRPTLTGGTLFLFVIRADRVHAVLRLAVLTLFGKRRSADDFMRETSQRLEIDSPKPVLEVAVDGEVVEMEPPLVYETHPQSLQVCVQQ